MSSATTAVLQPRGAGPKLGPATEYLPFVKKIVMRIARRMPSHVRVDDLMGAGVVGLLEAMNRYDPEQSVDFETFAEFRVRGAVLDELRGRDLMARDARSESKRFEQSIRDLAQDLGRAPDEDELAGFLGLDAKTLRDKLAKLAPVTVVSFEDLATSQAFRNGGESPFDETLRNEMIDRVTGAVEHLSERQQQVLHLYYRESLTLKQIGEVLGVTESRVCQILGEITVRLRSMVEPEKAASETAAKRRRRKRRK